MSLLDQHRQNRFITSSILDTKNMKNHLYKISDANEAVADVAYRLSELVAIYPITPSSPMAELCDEWAMQQKPNLLGSIPQVFQMQSEGGVAGAIHGALQCGSLVTTFTASQGLLLMIPNLYKIAGELQAFCMHVTARSLATHALSIFGDHSDVMACRQTGFAMLSSSSVQEAHDMACIAHIATLRSRIPFMHFFDGFRTSHEINTFQHLDDAVLQAMIPWEDIATHRSRALDPEHPAVRGTAQNPDVFFQAREAANVHYQSLASELKSLMDQFAQLTHRHYGLFQYTGTPDAEHIVICMGSGCRTLEKTAQFLQKAGEKVGVLQVLLYRPFSIEDFLRIIPTTVRSIAILDRTKEPGSLGEPLYLDVVAAIEEGRSQGHLPLHFHPKIIAGRYGLGSKEFSPAMAKAIFDELKKESPKRHFTIGIEDDVTHLSLNYDPLFQLQEPSVYESIFYGLGSDGTVGANKNTIKIIGNATKNFTQAYFVYDSKKSGAMTISHLRFGPTAIEAPYLIQQANFIGCHQFSFLHTHDILKMAKPGTIFLLNSPYDAPHTWGRLSLELQRKIQQLQIKFHIIDAYSIAKKAGIGGRINAIMQTCYFAISKILPQEEAIQHIKESIRKTYGKKGEAIVQKNFEAVDLTLKHLKEIPVADLAATGISAHHSLSAGAPEFVRNVTQIMLSGHGDDLPVSAMPIDGTWPSGTACWEKRNIAEEIPLWDTSLCIQCNKCVSVCPHAAIRSKFYPENELKKDAPSTFCSVDFRSQAHPCHRFTIQVSPEDCTGCRLCTEICPARSKNEEGKKALTMTPKEEILEQERRHYQYFQTLPQPFIQATDLKSSQFCQPLFEFSGACAGCGETPYIKLLTQLFGDHLIIANATGCSSIYSGNLPTTPYTTNVEGHGPAWSNSLFEDNAEYGYGMRIACDQKYHMAEKLLKRKAPLLGDRYVELILHNLQATPQEIQQQRIYVQELRTKLAQEKDPESMALFGLAESLIRKSIWIIGGDGWAYDIGYGGLDHILASGRNINVLVLDTEVYSNTGGQQSKSTSMGAIAKFASAGKALPKKDLGLLAMSYGNGYVAQIAIGAKDSQAFTALMEAEAYDGPSLIIAYSHCNAHGYPLQLGLQQQKKAVESGYWLLYRHDPRRKSQQLSALTLDSKEPHLPLKEYMQTETRFNLLMRQNPERAEQLLRQEESHIFEKYAFYRKLAQPPA
ncbi:MAG: pyruvate:ferredoxin (flavodoxin) oxidoreductase [Puniceicoccales bacterium]|jgi:pyruvate-ferredoxin/flavodoxin oxidoreductase|nr:pyruvate:ferredoxin (flavodoxin) oxidoreductase [Puniceicoccales bacterium]